MNIRKADNMNKKSFFLLLALLTLNLTACSDSAEETQQITTAAPNNYTAVSTDTTVSGEVTAIAGNYVTLALGTVEENKDDSDNSNSDDKSDGNYDMPSDLPDAPNNDGNGTPPEMPDGNMPSGDMPEMPSGDMNAPDGAGFGRGGRKSASITKSGEESSYMIPVGMTIAGLSGRSSDYSGITVGTILTLTVSEDGTVRAASAE
jgi:opacity protein-like surface antigen